MPINTDERNGNRKIYRYGNWIVSNVEGFSPGYHEYPREDGTITITSNDSDPAYYLLNTDDVHTADEGQTVEVVVNCKESTDNKPFSVFVGLGTFCEKLSIYPNKVIFDTANSEEFIVEPGKHRYTLSISAEKTTFYIDKVVSYINTNRQASLGRSILVGYDLTGVPGTGITDIYYVKSTAGAKKYILVENSDFELEIDHKNTFDSSKIHRYSRKDFEKSGYLSIGTTESSVIGNIYHINCTTNNVNCGNLVPCKQVSDDALGFYNIFDNTFYIIEGIVDYGTEVEGSQLPDGYVELEYLTFTGTQHIITSIPVNLASSLEITASINSSVDQNILHSIDSEQNNVQSLSISEKCAVYTNNLSQATSKQLIFGKKHVFLLQGAKLLIDGTEYSIKYKPWDPISYICGTWDTTKSMFDNKGLVAGCNIQLPERTVPESTEYYYRIRTVYNKGTALEQYSVWAYNHKEEPEQYIDITGTDVYVLPTTDKQLYSFNFTEETKKVLLPKPTKAQWKTYINNDSNYDLTVIYRDTIVDTSTDEPKQVEQEVQVLKPKEGYLFTFNTDNWITQLLATQQLFYIYPNNTINILTDTYYKRLPAESYIYSKDGESGVIAGLFRSYANETDLAILQQNTTREYLDATTMTPDDLFTKYKDIFNIDKALCKNKLEIKDLYLQLIKSQHLQTTKQGIYNVLSTITGAKPKISELYDLQSWTVYTCNSSEGVPNILVSSDNTETEEDEETNLLANDSTDLYYRAHSEMDFYIKDPYLPEKSERYYLVDHENPSRVYKPAVIWDSVDKSFTVIIEVYDPYNLYYGESEGSTSHLTKAYKELVKSFVKLFKPAHLKTYIRFYNAEGVIDEEHHWYYVYDAYNEAFYSQNKVNPNA